MMAVADRLGNTVIALGMAYMEATTGEYRAERSLAQVRDMLDQAVVAAGESEEKLEAARAQIREMDSEIRALNTILIANGWSVREIEQAVTRNRWAAEGGAIHGV